MARRTKAGGSTKPPTPKRATKKRVKVLVMFDGAFADVVTRHKKGHKLAKAAPEMGDATHVTRALVDADYDARAIALDNDPAAIVRAVTSTKWRPDVVMNLCDTLGGIGANALVVPAILESLGVPFAGASTSGMALSKRKHDVKAVLSREALPTPRYQVIHEARDVDEFTLRLEPPVIVKLSGEHASIGLEQASVCVDERETKARALAMFKKFPEQPLVIEEYVDGKELAVSFHGNPLQVAPPVEHAFHVPDGFLKLRTFDMKWTEQAGFVDTALSKSRARTGTATAVPVRAPTVDVGWSLDGLVEACGRAFEVIGCRDWGRVDVRIDKGGVPLIIDVTPNTFLGPNGPCVKAAQGGGVDYTTLVARIIEGALARAQ